MGVLGRQSERRKQQAKVQQIVREKENSEAEKKIKMLIDLVVQAEYLKVMGFTAGYNT